MLSRSLFSGFPFIDSRARMLGFVDPFEDLLNDPWMDLDRQVMEGTRAQPSATPMLASGESHGQGNKLSPPHHSQQPQQQQLQVPNRGSDQDHWLSYARAPALDVIDREKEFVINVDVPGVKKEDVKLQLNDNGRGQKVLSLTGERRSEATKEDRERGYRSQTRMYGKFSRSLVLPESAKAEGISAKFENGVLKIVVPKKEDAKQAQAPVNVNIE